MRDPLGRPSPWRGAALGLALLLAAAGVAAQSAGEVEFARGVGFAQTPGQTPRTLGRGLPVNEGDRLTTSDGASAIIKLEDGTRMTVRPNSELVLSQYKYKENDPGNGMLMQLVRGGFRAVTGLISKGSPNAARVQTATATIGIRGTDFDARLCSGDCAAESSKVQAAPRPNAVQASGKVVQGRGEIYAIDNANQRRRLVDGGAVYPGDMVETGSASNAVVAFRDDTRVTLGAATRFRVDNFVYDDKNAGEGRFLATLLKGSVRALTGLIAKANTRNVGFSTPTATIGIRGTGFDASCGAGDGCGELSLWTWLGAIEVTRSGDTALSLLQAGQGLFISPQGVQPLFTPSTLDGPRPDGVKVDPKLFAGETVSDAEEGLFVFVRDGHIEILTAKDVLHLGRGEAGFASPDGETKRPATIPKFIDFDKVPLPTVRNPQSVTLIGELGLKQAEQCR
jgi:hypothetical protein